MHGTKKNNADVGLLFLTYETTETNEILRVHGVQRRVLMTVGGGADAKEKGEREKEGREREREKDGRSQRRKEENRRQTSDQPTLPSPSGPRHPRLLPAEKH